MRWGLLPLAALLVTALPAQKLDRSPFHGDEASIGAGKAAFRLRCSACHGIHAEGGKGPALDRGDFNVGNTDLDLYRVIAFGVPGTEMPGFAIRSTEENIWRVVSYLRSFEPAAEETVDGDAERGAEVFWNRGGCGACHRVGQKGRNFGPDLTRIGRSRSVTHLREALLEPGGDLPRDYFVVRVVTKDGTTVRGLGLGFDDFSAQLMDASGRIHSYFREEVKSMEREFESLMPDTYGDMLSAGEQNDRLAYLQALRGEEGNK